MISPLTRRLLLSLAFVLGFFAGNFPPASAGTKGTMTGEDVAIAFFKTAQTTPDFDKWVKNNPDYKVTPPASIDEYTKKEKQRLLRRWRDYKPEEDTLDVRIHVMAKLSADGPQDRPYEMAIQFYDGNVTYFPYLFGNYKFAVMPQKMEELFHQPLSKEQYDSIKKNLRRDESAVLYLTLKPIKAHIDKPYEIEGVEQWVLVTDIASMSLKTKDERSGLWDYTAKWYVPADTSKILDLYRRP